MQFPECVLCSCIMRQEVCQLHDTRKFEVIFTSFYLTVNVISPAFQGIWSSNTLIRNEDQYYMLTFVACGTLIFRYPFRSNGFKRTSYSYYYHGTREIVSYVEHHFEHLLECAQANLISLQETEKCLGIPKFPFSSKCKTAVRLEHLCCCCWSITLSAAADSCKWSDHSI